MVYIVYFFRLHHKITRGRERGQRQSERKRTKRKKQRKARLSRDKKLFMVAEKASAFLLILGNSAIRKTKERKIQAPATAQTSAWHFELFLFESIGIWL